MSSHTPDSTPGTRLCIECQGLRLDDEGCGGFIGTSDNGTPTLKFKHEKVMGFRPGVLKLLMRQQRTDSSPDFPTLAKSAAAGCGLCGFLRAAVLRTNIRALGRQGEVFMVLSYAWGPRDGVILKDEGLQALLATIFDAQGNHVGALRFSVYSRDDSTATADWLGLHPGPRTETLCPENIVFLKDALENCTTVCHPPAETLFLPTRLLDLGTDATSHPRLIITAEAIRLGALSPAEPIRYAAVSYCWGDEADSLTQTKTEPSNLQERLRAIPTRDMSAVMQDSVAVCRALSVRYLWIDALCIIQDPADTSDWEKESERVGEVYQHAHFTICAMSTGSCHQSFLARSRHAFDLDFRSSLYPPAQREGGYTLAFTGLSDWSTLDYDPLSIDLLDSPWDNRGWVLQERKLSTRKLLFGQHMVHFECGGRQESENTEFQWLSGIMDWSAATIANLDRDEVHRHFRDMASVYASCRLSHESDRLPALSGLAKRVFDFVGGTYLAGLWMAELHYELLWNVAQAEQTLAERIDALRAPRSGSGAPSWSWVSRPGYFEYGVPGFDSLGSDDHLHPEYADINAWTVLKGAGLNPFGEVESGTIRVRGKVMPVPGDLVLIPQRMLRSGDAIRNIYDHKDVVACCFLDCADPSPELEPGRLEMLLVSSSCCLQVRAPAYYYADDRGEDRDGRGKTDNSDEDDDEGVDDQMVGEEHGGGPSQSCDSLSDANMDSSVTILEDAGSVPSSSNSSSSSNAAGACVHCNNKKRNRHARGLIIHPADKTGEYYRVGVFSSIACHGRSGGTHLFKDVEQRSIDII